MLRAVIWEPWMVAQLSELFHNWRSFLSNPFILLAAAFQIWMLVDAIRREEWFWAVCIFFFPVFSPLLYFFMVYRGSPSVTRGFELPGAHHRKRIRELEGQIHHLDKAHHHSQLGDIYFQQGKMQKAEACYRAALEREADDIDTRSHLGQCLLRQKRSAEALPLLEGVCAENPKHDYGYTLMALAETYETLDKVDQAQATWEKVLETNSYARARVQLAEIYLKRNQLEKARGQVREALAEDKHAPTFQRKRERPWIRKARALSRKLPRTD